MAVTDILKSFILGGISTLGVIIVFFVFFYWLPKTLGLFKFIKKLYLPKIPQEVYEDVAEDVISKKKFNEVTETYLKYPKKRQEQYFRAYEELKEINKDEGL